MDVETRDPKPDSGTSIYDHPLYYDILVGWDRDPEARFYDQVFQHHGVPRGSTLVEVACGTGLIAVRLAKLGWQVTGVDLQQSMVDFTQQAAEKAGVCLTTMCGDMRDFALPEPVDAAYCPLGTIGYVQTDALMLKHFDTVARNIKPGGIYVVDAGHIDEASVTWDPSEEEWDMERDGITVASEGGKVIVHDPARGDEPLELTWGHHLRLYATDVFVELAGRCGVFTLEACYPEARIRDDGVSLFDITHRTDSLVSGRSVVVLRRR